MLGRTEAEDGAVVWCPRAPEVSLFFVVCVCVSVCLSVCVSVCLCVCVSVCLGWVWALGFRANTTKLQVKHGHTARAVETYKS